jgi:hypothetical protein
VLGEAPRREHRSALAKSGKQTTIMWRVRCDCGTEGERTAENLTTGKSRSCGCEARERRRIPLALGEQYGLLTVIGEAPPDRKGRRWLCRCDCGTELAVAVSDLRRKDARANRSCGCTRRTVFYRSHGLGEHPLYTTWRNMLDRCLNPANTAYYNYGFAGVTVCERWADLETGCQAFIDDMGEKPDPGHSIERRDPLGPYSPENCRWATRKEQRANQRKLPRVRIDLLRQCAVAEGIPLEQINAALARVAALAPKLEVAQTLK